MENLPVYGIENFEGTATFAGQFYAGRLSTHLQKHDFVTRPHRHDFFILLYISNGSGTHIIDFVSYQLAPGTLFILLPGQVHSWTLSEDIEGYLVFFSRELMEGYFTKHLSSYTLLNGRIQRLLFPESRESIHRLMDTIYHEYHSPLSCTPDVIRDYLDILLLKSACLGVPDSPAAMESGNWQIRELEKLIEENYLKHSSPAFYADKLNISTKYLNALCQKYLHKTTSALIQERIILEAKRLLTHDDISVKEIAGKLNFEDFSYFIRFFKKATGMTPQEFRGSI